MRIGRRTRVKLEAIDRYREIHGQIWPSLLALNAAAGIRNYTIFMSGCELFSYFEVHDLGVAQAILENSELALRWQALMAPLMDASDPLSPWETINEVFHQD